MEQLLFCRIVILPSEIKEAIENGVWLINEEKSDGTLAFHLEDENNKVFYPDPSKDIVLRDYMRVTETL